MLFVAMLCTEFVIIYCSVLSSCVVDNIQNTILFRYPGQIFYIDLSYKNLRLRG